METKEETNRAKGEKKAKDRHLTVTVNAHDLYPLSSTEHNVDANTSLSDAGGFTSGYGASKKNYETIVYKGKKVTWNIEVEEENGKNKDYSVDLVSVSHNPKPPTNPNLFDHNPLKPEKGSTKKSIKGTIVHNPPLPENYTINFKIIFNGDPKPFHLDPKLKVNT